MSGWTKPRVLAFKNTWFDDNFDYDGPACYELGTGGPRGGSIKWHYVGETVGERKRMSEYGRSGSELGSVIRWHLKEGWYLYYCSQACTSKRGAKKMQDSLLSRFTYDWNAQLNGDN